MGKDFIDLHCHILPGVDDGASSRSQSIEMLKIAYDNGFRTICATPHYRQRRFVNDIEKLKDEVRWLQQEAIRLKIPVKICLGNEIYYCQELLENLEIGKCLPLAGTKYVLVEFHPAVDYIYLQRGLKEIRLGGYRPILAHIERYDCMYKDGVAYAEELMDMGVVIQVNASSLKDGFKTSRFVKKLLKYELVQLIATDSHSDGTRSPNIESCVSYITKKYGQDYVEDLLHHNPKKILENEYL